MSELIVDIQDSSFENDVLNADIPVMVDFWAPWCPPCKSLAPTLEVVAKEYEGKIRIFKMNVDDNPHTPSKYNVRSIPNLIFFREGQVVEQIFGAVQKQQLSETIDKVLG